MATNNTTAFFLVLLLAGCGGNTQPGAPNGCDFEGETGICVAFDDGAEWSGPPSAFEFWFTSTRACVAAFLQDDAVLAIRGPVVRVVAQKFFIEGELRDGWTNFDTGQITIANTGDDPHRLFQLMQHESVHYLLLRRGVPDHLNSAHEHPTFPACSEI